MRDTKAAFDRRTHKKKTRRVAAVLERVLGVPEQQHPLPEPLELLIATILSQNTNDKNSHRAYSLLRQRYPTWEHVAAAPLRSLIATIKPGGMARQKSLRIKEVLQTFKSRYGGYDLSDLATKTNEQVISELTGLNGVGVKTASCVLLFSLGRDIFPVDTHVHRVCGRLGLAPGCKTPDQTFKVMQGLVPPRKGYSFHTNLIRFGRKICRANHPACNRCPLYDECLYENKTRLARQSRSRSNTDHDFMLLDHVKDLDSSH